MLMVFLIPLGFLILAILAWPRIIPADELSDDDDNGWPCLAESPGSGYPDWGD